MDVTITADSVTMPQEGLFIVTVRLVGTEASAEVLNTTHQIKYRPGDDVVDSVEEMTELFQKDIDDYNAGQQLKNSQGMTNAMTAIQNGLVT